MLKAFGSPTAPIELSAGRTDIVSIRRLLELLAATCSPGRQNRWISAPLASGSQHTLDSVNDLPKIEFVCMFNESFSPNPRFDMLSFPAAQTARSYMLRLLTLTVALRS